MSIFLPGGHACRGNSRFQRDKTGRPCIEHCRRVADAVDTIDQRRLPTFTTLSKKAKAEPPSSKRRLGQKNSFRSRRDVRSGEEYFAFVRRCVERIGALRQTRRSGG